MKAFQPAKTVKPLYIGKRDQECKHCGAMFFRGQNKNCCRNGDIKLDQIPTPPSPLKELYNRVHEFAKIFIKFIIQLNSVFGFTSIGVPGLDQRLIRDPKGGGCFRMQGNIYHRLGALQPESGQPPKFSSIYFYNSEIAIARRQEILQGKRSTPIPHCKEIITIIQNSIESVNKLVKQYVQHGRSVLEQPEKEMIIVNNHRIVDIRVVSNEFLVIVPENSDLSLKRNILLKLTGGQFENINHLHSLHDSLAYPLLFVYGQPGWNVDLKDRKNRKITLRDYVNYHLQIRKNNFNQLFKAGPLFHQFVCNKYVDIETERLNFIRFNQKRFRVEMYKGLVDAYLQKCDLKDIGKLYILPSSFVGGPRYMKELYNDAMALVVKYGKPDLFITMTTNPDWQEVKEDLAETGQTSWEQFEAAATVFVVKAGMLEKEIYKGKIFGEVLSMVWVIEFQFRGLAHIHMLVKLKNVIATPRQVDGCVCAEIPDPERFSELYERVKKFMIHRPCENYPASSCWKDGKCSKRFPKELNLDGTMVDLNTYPTYRRRGRFNVTLPDGKVVSDEYTVPYNPYLLMRYNCHINVEVCSDIKAAKYLFGYLFKGSDYSTLKITEFDEIETFVANRSLSSTESLLRTRGIRLHNEKPDCLRLAIHLPDLNFCAIPEDLEDSEIQEYLESNKKTTLTEWFEYNKQNDDALDLTYLEFGTRYRWNKTTKQWTKFKNKIRKAARMHVISPKNVELFYLRAILRIKKGCKSFKDCLTVDERTYKTFQETAIAMGFLKNEDFWIETMEETIMTQNVRTCRNVFAYLLLFGGIHNTIDFWLMFKDRMGDDFCRKHPNSSKEFIDQLILNELQNLLSYHNMNLIAYKLPEAKKINNFEQKFLLSQKELENFERDVKLLTSEQKAIFDQIIEAVLNQNEELYFIDAPGGTGKTFVLNLIICKLILSKKKIAVVASSGIASTLLINGRTAHSLFGIPLELFEDSVCDIGKRSSKAEFLKSIDL